MRWCLSVVERGGSVTTMTIEPVREHYDLTSDPAHAFETYVNRIGEWWHPLYTEGADTFDGVTIEPSVGGSVVERHRDGRRFEWGTVRSIEPAREISYTSNLGQAGGDPTLVSVRFEPAAGGGTSVDFEHGGWNETNAADRAKFTDWRLILDRFAHLADEGTARIRP
jgi:uncharacterized protein YndB with AHSA1/START domain